MKLASKEQRYFVVMKWSKFHTNGCDLICTNINCDESYVSYLAGYPTHCKKCNSRLWEPDMVGI